MSAILRSLGTLAILGLIMTACDTTKPMEAEEKAMSTSELGVLSEEELRSKIVGNTITGPYTNEPEKTYIEYTRGPTLGEGK